MKSTASLFAAAIESASIFNHAVVQCAASSGLLDVLATPSNVDQIMQRMRFRPERREQVLALLRILVRENVVLERKVGETCVFALPKSAPPKDGLAMEHYHPHHDKIGHWFGEKHVELIRTSNQSFLGRDLGLFRSQHAAIKFNRDFESAWRTNLTNPLYEFGRVRCVREMALRGNRFLDLACGPGFGAQCLAEYSTTPATIVGVDKSSDFIEIASSIIYPNASASFFVKDLNDGIPSFAPGSFDGVLFNGAFHFIQDKRARLREIHRALRVGGLLAIGHCFSRSGFLDEEMHEFYFSLLADRSWPLDWPEIIQLVEETGFSVIETFHRGSHSYLLAECVAEQTPDALEIP